VLVADDQPSFREHLEQLLRGAGYEVLVAYDGQQALRMCRRDLPDVAVLDVIMPNLDGVQVCQALRSDPALPYIPIVFVSSRADPSERAAGLRAGADDYLGKPFHDDELLARVEAVARVASMLRNAVPAELARQSDAARDELTGVWSAAHIDDRLAAEIERASRHNEPLTVMVIDFDERDALGDDGLVAGAAAIGRCTRAMDIIGRCTRLAFAVILPNTHFAGAIATADRIWRELAATRIGDLPLRASMGVACYPNQQAKTADQLLEFARHALDRALAEGPAHICLFQHQAYIFRPE